MDFESGMQPVECKIYFSIANVTGVCEHSPNQTSDNWITYS